MPSPVRFDAPLGRQEAARRFLFGRIDYERAPTVPYRLKNFKLDRVRELLGRLGNPHLAMPAVHVAGTKGKGSTAAMLGAVLSASGYRTGLFTSPHLDRVEERMAVDGRPCSPAELAELVDLVSPAVEAMDQAAARQEPPEIGPTYFEVITAVALLHFSRQKVDGAVLEVGLGGRLDATNVCRPQVSVITGISLDHTQQLGNDLKSIAREKGGIIKPGVPVISGVVEPEPRGVIREVCGRQGCPLAELGVDFDFEYFPPRRLDAAPALPKMDFRYAYQGRRDQYRQVSLGLLGHHQAANAATALAALAELGRQGWRIPEAALRAGLAGLSWPVRIELLARRPAIIVDSAHNVASVEALVRALDESFSVRRRWLLFATTRGKDVRGMLRRLLRSFEGVVFTRYTNNPRAVPPEELDALAEELTGRRCAVCPRPADAWQQVSARAAADDLICVTGSFFIAAEIRPLIQTRLGVGAAKTRGDEH